MRSIIQSIYTNIAQNKATYASVALYVPLCWLAALWVGYPERFSLIVYSEAVATTSLMILVFFLSFICLRIMFVERPRRLTQTIIEELRSRWLTQERLVQGVLLILLYMVFMAAFSSMKSLIPAFQPYIWDAAWMGWDRVLHGTDPWKLTHAVFGAPLATFIINFIYNLWFPIMFAVLYWQAFTLKEPGLRRRFFFAFFLTWMVNGTLLAILMSSAGPCFFEPMLGDPAFTPLMDRLREINEIYPIWAIQTQDLLWLIYESRGLDVGSGISAMPSVHVAIAFLLFLFGVEKGRAWAIAFFIFFLLILLGSVHLGWHYAVDGYVAMVVTACLWWFSGFIYKDKSA